MLRYVIQHGGVRGFMFSSGDHGERAVPLSGQCTTSEDKVW